MFRRNGVAIRGNTTNRPAAAEHHHHRYRTRRIGRRPERHLNINTDRRVRCVVHVPGQLSQDNRSQTGHRLYRFSDRPSDLGNILRNAADHLPLEVLDNFEAALAPPHFRGGDFFAILKFQDLRQIWEGIGLGFVVIGVIGSALVAVWPRPKRLYAELLHHILMIVGSGPIHGRLLAQRGAGQDRQKPSYFYDP